MGSIEANSTTRLVLRLQTASVAPAFSWKFRTHRNTSGFLRLPGYSTSLHEEATITCLLDLVKAQARVAAALLVVKIKPQFGRFICVKGEALVYAVLNAGLGCAVVVTVDVHVQRRLDLCVPVKRDAHLDDVLRILKRELDPAPLRFIFEQIQVAQPVR